jgi:hypothetical protein
MAGNGNTRRTVLQKETISTTHAAWSTPVKLGRLGKSGLLARSVIRYASGTNMTAADLRVWVDGETTVAAGSVGSIADEDLVLERTAITITGSATDADDDYNILGNTGGAPYDVRGDIDDPTAPGALWVSVKPTGSGTEDVVLLIAAVDVK